MPQFVDDWLKNDQELVAVFKKVDISSSKSHPSQTSEIFTQMPDPTCRTQLEVSGFLVAEHIVYAALSIHTLHGSIHQDSLSRIMIKMPVDHDGLGLGVVMVFARIATVTVTVRLGRTEEADCRWIANACESMRLGVDFKFTFDRSNNHRAAASGHPSQD